MVHNLGVDTKNLKFTRIITRNEEQFMAYINLKVREASGNSFVNSYTTTVVTESYTVSEYDEYIGVVSVDKVTITLPTSSDGKSFIIKNELGETSGIIEVVTAAEELIDRAEMYHLTSPFESATFVSRGGNWYVI